MNKANELEKLNKDSESNEYNTTREFSNGYEGHMSLGTYFEVYGKVINSKPSYQRPYHYPDTKDSDYTGNDWQQNLIADVLRGGKIPSISLRQTKEPVNVDIATRAINTYIQELLDGGHRSRTMYNFYTGHLLTSEGLTISIGGTVHDCGKKRWDELPKEVREHALQDIMLNIDVFVGLTDDEAGAKFRTLNNLIEMTAQEKRQSYRTQIAESVRELGAIDQTEFEIFSMDTINKKRKFDYVKLDTMGRDTDELVATLVYLFDIDFVSKNLRDRSSFLAWKPSKGQLDSLYENDLSVNSSKASKYNMGSKDYTLMSDVQFILTMIDKIVVENKFNKPKSVKSNLPYWTKASIVKLAFILDDLISRYGKDSIEEMDVKMFFDKLKSIIDNKKAIFRAYSRYTILDGKVVASYEKPVDKEVKAQIRTVWGTGNRIDDYEFVKLNIDLNFNPTEWGIYVLDKLRDFTESQRKQIFARDDHKCVDCGSEEKLEADHKLPWSKGGKTTIGNGQTLCEYHNRSKSDKVDVSTLNTLSLKQLGDLWKMNKVTQDQYNQSMFDIMSQENAV
jgi:hypothetical protein|tara:strand:+ start:2025 stop:3713 length:1689 start_codon:yes stop_codon:yes gene_type:complete